MSTQPYKIWRTVTHTYVVLHNDSDAARDWETIGVIDLVEKRLPDGTLAMPELYARLLEAPEYLGPFDSNTAASAALFREFSRGSADQLSLGG